MPVRWFGTASRTSRNTTDQLQLELLHFDSPRSYDLRFLHVRLCMYGTVACCLLACLARLAPQLTRSPKASRQIHRPTATVAKTASLPKLLAPSPLGALSTEYEGGVLIPHC